MLRQLMLNKKIRQKKDELEELRKKQADFDTRSKGLESAIDEAKTEEEIKTVEDEIEALEKEKQDFVGDESKLLAEIDALEKELTGLEENKPESVPDTAPSPTREKERNQLEKGELRMKHRFFRNMNIEQRDRFMADSAVKDFLERTREMIGQKRAVTAAELTIPEVMLDMLRDNLHRYSKLISKVRVKTVLGKARQNIAGAIPEGVWTEAIGSLNELELSFKQVEVDGYKVGGFVPVPNSTLEDSDINLMDEIMDMLAQAIGYAVDKAIAYGTGVKMPVGIATRLAETAKPAYWGQSEQPWTDLHVSNVVKIDPTNKTKEEFFAELIEKAGIPAPNYNASNLFWIMNRKTFMYLVAKALVFNAAGAIVSAQNNTMPVIGGDVEILEFMSDYDIIGGYGSIYLLAEREGAQLAKSEHVKFIEDQTVFKGTARYDGRPVFGEAFVAINVNNAAPTMTKSFAIDNANF